MNNGTLIARAVLYYICALALVYLTWVGAQYVFETTVVLEITDHALALFLARYLARDAVNVFQRLDRLKQLSNRR